MMEKKQCAQFLGSFKPWRLYSFNRYLSNPWDTVVGVGVHKRHGPCPRRAYIFKRENRDQENDYLNKDVISTVIKRVGKKN